MKISVIGAGNVGGLSAMRIAQDGAAEVVLVDIAKGLAQGKSFDMDDSRALVKCDFHLTGSDDMAAIAGSDVVVVTAGLARKPGMTREDLLNKNAGILKEVCGTIKNTAPSAIVVIVTNPLDLMTRFAIQATGFQAKKVIGMGVSLDAARFANLIAYELKVPVTDVDACVIGSHGEGMMPMPRFTTVKGVPLTKLCSQETIDGLVKRTVGRGLEIVTCLGSGSAYFAPSAAVCSLVRSIAKDEKRIIGVSAQLSGEYGISGPCLGIPCRIGRQGIEQVVALELNASEKEVLAGSAAKLSEQFKTISL